MPFVGVATDLKTRIQRSKQLLPLLIGILFGGVVLWLLCHGLVAAASSLGMSPPPTIMFLCFCLALLFGDIWALSQRVLYPLSATRQARQSLEVAFSIVQPVRLASESSELCHTFRLIRYRRLAQLLYLAVAFLTFTMFYFGVVLN